MAKTATQQQARIDEMMEEASQALVARDYFLCEKISVQALRRAHALHDFDRMARILMPLQEARRQKRDLARDSGRVKVTNDQIPAGKSLVPGCYLIAPPRVGMDGRLLREAADEQRIPVIVVVREPTTREGLWPIVAVGPSTIRAKMKPPPPKAPKKARAKAPPSPAAEPAATPEPVPTADWFIDATEALGDAAIEQVSTTAAAATRVDQLMLRIETLPDHEKLHQRLAEACRQALHEPPPKKRPLEELFDQEDA